MTNEDELINRIAEVYKPYKTEAEKLRELSAELHELKLRVRRLEEFCKLQAQVNEDLVLFLKITEI